MNFQLPSLKMLNGAESICSRFYRLMISIALIVVCLFPLSALAAGGDVIWQFGDLQAGKQEAKATIADSEGNMIVTGYQNLSGGTNDDYLTIKFKGDGSGVAWRVLYDRAGGTDQATAVAVDTNNDVIVTGFIWNGLNRDIYTVKYSGVTGAILWQHTFNGLASGNDIGTSVAVDSLNNIFIGGYTQNNSGNDDYIVMKFGPNGPRPDGTPLWQAIYNGPANGIDQAFSIATGPDGVAVIGQSWNGVAFDMLTVKYDFNGTKLWDQRYSSGPGNNCTGKILKLDTQGNVVASGSVWNGIDLDVYTGKYNSSTGAIIWQRSYVGAYDDEPNYLITDQAGDVYITGYAWTIEGFNDFYTARYNGSNGNVIWEKLFDSGNSNTDIAVATGLGLDPAGDVYVTGYTIENGNSDYQTLKYKKEDGNQLWQRSFNGSGGRNDRPVGIGISPTGEAMVAGWSDSGATGQDYYVIKYEPGLLNAPTNLTAQTTSTSSIQLNWIKNSPNEEGFKVERCSGLQCVNFVQIAETAQGAISFSDSGLTEDTYYSYRVKAFNSTIGNSHYSNTATALTTYVATAIPAWVYTKNSLAGNDDYANAIAVGPDNNPVVTGYTNDYPPGYTSGITSFDYLTIKLNRADNTPVWSNRYNDPMNASDVATCVAVDSANTVAVSGYATLFNGYADVNSLFTLKYSGSGTQIGTGDKYHGPAPSGSTDDRAVAIAAAIDPSNNTAVVGYGKNGAGYDDIYLLKHNSAGERIWAATPFSGAGGNNMPTAVAFAPDGSIYVAGYTEKGVNSGKYDFFVARYNGTTNAMIWNERYSPVVGGDNRANSLVMDSSGNVIVTGYATNASGN